MDTCTIRFGLGDDPVAGEKALRAEIRLTGGDSGLFYFLGRALERQSSFEKASAAFREAYERLKRGR